MICILRKNIFIRTYRVFLHRTGVSVKVSLHFSQTSRETTMANKVRRLILNDMGQMWWDRYGHDAVGSLDRIGALTYPKGQLLLSAAAQINRKLQTFIFYYLVKKTRPCSPYPKRYLSSHVDKWRCIYLSKFSFDAILKLGILIKVFPSDDKWWRISNL